MFTRAKATLTREGKAGPGASLLAGLLTGATIGLIAAVLSAPLRRLAGVGDRALVNGVTIVAGALVLWLLLGGLYAALRSEPRTARTVIIAVTGVVAIVVTFVIYVGLADYALRLPSLAEPLALIVLLGGAALFFTLLEYAPRMPLRAVAPAGLVMAIIAAVLVSVLDRTPAVRYTLSKRPAAVATPATARGSAVAPAGTTAAAAASRGTTSTAAGAGSLHFVVSNASETAFTVNEKLTRLPAPSDAVGKTNSVSGDLYLIGGKGIAGTAPSTISVDLRTLATDSPMRDGFIKMATLQTSQYPMATYTVTGIDGFPPTYKEGDEVKVTVNGTMKIHGTDQPVAWTGTARFAAGQLEVVLATDVTMSEFGMTPPSVPVVQSVSDKVHLNMHLVAAQQGV